MYNNFTFTFKYSCNLQHVNISLKQTIKHLFEKRRHRHCDGSYTVDPQTLIYHHIT